MSHSNLSHSVIFGLSRSADRLARILVWTLASGSFAQDCQTIAVDDNDGLLRSPQSYSLLYETDDVRVLEATIPPGSSQLMHSFTRPAILYVQSSVDSKTISPGVNDPIEHQQDRNFRPTVIRIGAPWLYATENLSKYYFRAVRIELKHPGCRLMNVRDDRNPLLIAEGEGVAMQKDVFRTVYEDGDVRVSEIDTPVQTLASLPSFWPGFYYVVTAGHGGTKGRVVSTFPIGSEPAQSFSLTPKKSVHVVRFELKQASGQ